MYRFASEIKFAFNTSLTDIHVSIYSVSVNTPIMNLKALKNLDTNMWLNENTEVVEDIIILMVY